ncbi:putative phosphatidate phosphatase [Anticarsia gemmatalis]|uniref:putative phosphatidate phosphatase n=1 Tax=Anticarsia gemmatalis TaxID=129554 RepID=UPI003F7689AD
MAVDRLIWKIIIDFIVLACVGIPLLVLLLWIEPYERGYFEDDMSLRLPFKPQQISIGALAISGFVIVISTILIVEVVRDKQGKGIGEKFLSGSLIPGWLWESYNTIGIFVFGAACQQLTSDLAKAVIGRLRPHFYDLCNPSPTGGSTSSTYITSYTCLSTAITESQKKDMKMSFPSSHSSFAMYCAIFFVLYLQVKCKWRGSKLLRHAVQFAAVIGAWYVGLSRVVDHMHHWSDVAVGFAIGAVYACLVFKFVLKPKNYSALPTQWEEPPVNNTLPRAALAR